MLYIVIHTGASTEVTARGVNALATWMIEHPMEEIDEPSPGGVVSPTDVITPPTPEMPALGPAERDR